MPMHGERRVEEPKKKGQNKGKKRERMRERMRAIEKVKKDENECMSKEKKEEGNPQKSYNREKGTNLIRSVGTNPKFKKNNTLKN